MRVSSFALCAALSLPSANVSGFTSTKARVTDAVPVSTYMSSSPSPKPFGVPLHGSSALCMAWGDRDDNSYRNNNDDGGYEYSTNSRPSPSPYASSDGHDYERDTSSDTSNVDVDAVNGLLGERLRARKKGDFDTADSIRDQLSAEHKVTVFDKDKIWVTGDDRGQQGVNRGGRRGDTGGGRGGGRGGAGRGGGKGGRGGRGTMERRPNRDFRSDFGPNGHDYDACKEAGPISSAMSELEIHSKVAERLMAKMNRDFETADKVQLDLAEEGVYINDTTKEWRADGVRFIDPSEGRKPPSDRNRAYVQSRHSLPLPEDAKYEKIAQLVSDRTKYKQFKKFGEADRVRDTLIEDFDIVIDDRIREWSVGGGFGKDADIKRAHSEAMKSRDYVKSSASLDLPDGVTDKEVQDKVDARMRAKTNRQYHESDAMRDEILEEYGVVIHDTIKMWSVGGDFGMDDPVKARVKALSTFTRRGGGILSEGDVVLIQAMLTKRFEAKRVRNFDAADEIRSSLYTTYNINIDDKSREWRVLSDDYVQTKAERGARELTAEEVSMVESKIVKRTLLKKEKSYEEADAIRDELQDIYSILMDDKKKEWKVISSGGRVGGNSKFSQEAASSQLSAYKQKQIDQEVEEELDSIFVEEPMKKVKDEFDLKDSPISVAAIADVPEKESAPSPSTLSKDELTSLTVPLLKEKLRELSKPVSGKKAELIERLLAL